MAFSQRPFVKSRIFSYGPKYQQYLMKIFMLSLSKVSFFSGKLYCTAQTVKTDAIFRRSNFFCCENMDLSLTKGSMLNFPGNMMITSEFDETGKVCSIWIKCDSLSFCWILLWVLLQAPTTRLAVPLYQNKHFVSKIYIQSHFVHMLQTLPVSSNSELLIIFPV